MRTRWIERKTGHEDEKNIQGHEKRTHRVQAIEAGSLDTFKEELVDHSVRYLRTMQKKMNEGGKVSIGFGNIGII